MSCHADVEWDQPFITIYNFEFCLRTMYAELSSYKVILQGLSVDKVQNLKSCFPSSFHAHKINFLTKEEKLQIGNFTFSSASSVEESDKQDFK